ncbi:unnamed protein product [Schistocephalus solidus]|uniref:NR4A2 n=1 Tax=Schistocephalus solidus TaxID=70667 RepID=A0A183SDF3_SCHSO|nr:unnamed protein product [Schistocephalus solidus]
MSTDVFKQTQTCGGNGDVDEDSQMGRLECFETLSSGTDSNATDERTKVPSYSLSFSSVDGVESRSTSGHSDSAEQPSHDDGDDTDNTKCSPNSSLKRAFPSPGKSPKAKAKRPASSGGKQSSSSSTPGPSVDYPGMSEHVDSSCYDFDPFQVHNFAESFKSPTAFPTPNYFSPECTTPSLQNSNSYESPEAPDLEDGVAYTPCFQKYSPPFHRLPATTAAVVTGKMQQLFRKDSLPATFFGTEEPLNLEAGED